MMTQLATVPVRLKRNWYPAIAVCGVIVAAVAAFFWRKSQPPPTPDAPSVREPAANAEANQLRFSAAKQSAAGIKTAVVEPSSAVQTMSATGKLAVNEDRLAHVYSFVEGVLREANVRLGQQVAAGEVLAMVDSKEVGRAKLNLAKNRLAATFAEANRASAKTIHDNTQALIAELQKNPEVNDLESRFRDQPMGDNRQLLVSAYAKFHQTEADHRRLKTLHDQNVGVERDYIRAKADYESAAAAYQALLEQLKFSTARQLREADQKLQEADTDERMSRAELLIMGLSETEIDKLDPLTEGEAVAHYPIRAPFAGTVIAKHAVLSEYVGPTHQLYEIADLSKIWIHVDLFEKDLAALAKMKGKSVTFRAAGYPGREFSAEIFHSGDSVDERTRAVTLIAAADNDEHLLKPGMFVEVTLPIGAAESALRIPASAVQTQGREQYVFVARDGDLFERRPIVTGHADSGRIEVTSGLTAGERIVVEGGFALKSELLRDQMTE